MARWPFDKLYIPEMVTIHEFTHGYWMGLVASNEFEESWMDEGINTFTELVMVDRKYGSFLTVPPGIGFTNEEQNRAQAALTQDHDPILAAAWKYSGEGSYGRNSYPQTGTTVQQIRLLLGEETFWKAFRGYAERWRFDHPTSEDFFDFMRSSGNPLVADLIKKTWYGRGWIDFAVLSAATHKDDGFTGFDDADKPVNFDPDPKKPEKKKDDKGKNKDKGTWQSLVTVIRDGDITMPAHVVMTLKDGTKIDRTWDGASDWIKYRLTTSSPLVKAEVDPERRTVLDRNPWNNVRYTEKYEGPSAVAKGRTYALHFVEILLSTLWGVL
jgi:hypothetical protein